MYNFVQRVNIDILGKKKNNNNNVGNSIKFTSFK